MRKVDDSELARLGTVNLLVASLGCSTISTMKPATQPPPPVTDKPLAYALYRFPPDVISYAVRLYYCFRLRLRLRMAEQLLAARDIELTSETVRRWSVKFGLGIARRIRSTALALGGSGTSMKVCHEHKRKLVVPY